MFSTSFSSSPKPLSNEAYDQMQPPVVDLFRDRHRRCPIPISVNGSTDVSLAPRLRSLPQTLPLNDNVPLHKPRIIKLARHTYPRPASSASPPPGNSDEHIELITQLYRHSARDTFSRLPLESRNGEFFSRQLPSHSPLKEFLATAEQLLTHLDTKLRDLRYAPNLRVRLEIHRKSAEEGKTSFYECPLPTDSRGVPTNLNQLRSDLRQQFHQRIKNFLSSSSEPSGAA